MRATTASPERAAEAEAWVERVLPCNFPDLLSAPVIRLSPPPTPRSRWGFFFDLIDRGRRSL